MNFAAVFGVSLRSGDALPACRPENGTPRRQPAELPLIESGKLSRQSRPSLIAAFTESKAFYTNYRFRKLGLDGLIDYLYSPEDHSMPDETPGIRYYEPESYNFKKTIHHFTPEGEVKPNPEILREIISDLGACTDQVAYAGDNILKDVFMAQQAGVTDVHALYGASQHKPEYELLRKVTHWPPEMVERERKALVPGGLAPTYVLDKNFAQILPLFELP